MRHVLDDVPSIAGHTENSSGCNQEKDSNIRFEIDIDEEEAKADASDVAESSLDIVGNKPKNVRKNSPNSVEVRIKPKKARKKQVLVEGMFFFLVLTFPACLRVAASTNYRSSLQMLL